MNTKNITRAAAVLTLAAGLGAGASLPAMASHGGGGVERSGTCSAGSVWTLKAKTDNGALEVEAQVDSNVVGQNWSWRIADNGTLAAKGQATTIAPSGSFSVNRHIPNLAGADKIVFRASNPASGETCRGTVTL
jgi:hypothetical protein